MSERLLPAARPEGRTLVSLPDRSRAGGLMVFAPSGWGKSRLLGRAIAHQDFLRGVGLVVFDVVGATIDNALDKLLYLPAGLQRQALGRVRYCNMAGERGRDGRVYVPAFPMLCPQSEGESLFITAQRVVDLIAKPGAGDSLHPGPQPAGAAADQRGDRANGLGASDQRGR